MNSRAAQSQTSGSINPLLLNESPGLSPPVDRSARKALMQQFEQRDIKELEKKTAPSLMLLAAVNLPLFMTFGSTPVFSAIRFWESAAARARTRSIISWGILLAKHGFTHLITA